MVPIGQSLWLKELRNYIRLSAVAKPGKAAGPGK